MEEEEEGEGRREKNKMLRRKEEEEEKVVQTDALPTHTHDTYVYSNLVKPNMIYNQHIQTSTSISINPSPAIAPQGKQEYKQASKPCRAAAAPTITQSCEYFWG